MGLNSIQLQQGKPMARGTRGRSYIDQYPQLATGIMLFFILCLGFFLYRLAWDPVNIHGSALIIVAAALLPGYLWAKGRRSGMPILPLYTFMLLWSYALPLLVGNPAIKPYNQDEVFFSALSTALYIISATASWYLVTRRGYKLRKAYYVIPEKHGYKFFIIFLLVGCVFTKLLIGGAIELDPGVFAIVRSIIFTFMGIAMFVLAYQMGRRELTRFQAVIFIVAALFSTLMQLATLYLVGAMAGIGLALVGYAVGRRRVPWKCIVVTFMVFGLLQAGKQEIRDRYTFENPRPMTLVELPGLFMDWSVAGVDGLLSVKREGEAPIQIYDRVSLVHLLLMVQRATPRDVPYLNGATYIIIPRVLVPRFLNPGKLSPHTAARIMNLHYALQSGTSQTSIAWGVLNEAYVNFGLPGIVGVACFVGCILGLVGGWTAGAPILSMQNLVGVTFLMNAIQVEQTMAVTVSILFQSLIILFLVLPLLVRRTARIG